jgi:hypothetical protein
MDWKGRYADNIFVERLWRTVKYEEVYLKAYANATKARMELVAYFRFYTTRGPIKPWASGLRPKWSTRPRMPGESKVTEGPPERVLVALACATGL